MILKGKKNIFICILFCILLIQIYSNDGIEFKINDGPMILHGKNLDFNVVYTKEDIEKKFGKPTFYKYANGEVDIVYEDDGNIITLYNNNVFKCIGIDFNIFHKVDIKGLIIERGDTYSQIIKKIENKKFDFTVGGAENQAPTIIIKFFTKNIGRTELHIWFSYETNRKVAGLIYAHTSK